MLNPVHLRTLQEVVRQSSFVGAANRLGYTPSAVSQQMAALEAEVGIELFDRSARRVRPNAAATIMAERASAVLASMESMITATTASQRQDGVARLSAFPSLGSRIVPALLDSPGLAEAQLSVSVSLHDPSLAIQELRAHGAVDVALVYRMGGTGLWWPSSYEPEHLATDDFTVVAPAAWGVGNDERASIHDFADRPWILHHPNSSDAEVIAELFASRGIRPRVVGRSDDYAATLDLVAAGMAAAFVPRPIVDRMPPGAVACDVDDFPMQREIYALRSTVAPAQRIDVIMTAIREAMVQIGYASEAPVD